MMSYSHLSEDERKVIKKMQLEGKSQNQIAQYLGRHRSTISRELKRNKEGYWYRAPTAHKKSLVSDARIRKNANLIPIKSLGSMFIERLKDRIAPDAISGRLKLTHKDSADMQISHKAIYNWIYDKALKGDDLYKNLPRGVKKRKRRLNKRQSRLTIPNRVSIHERLEAVKERKEIGHWEGDTISGKQGTGYIVTSVERKSLFLVAGLMINKSKGICNRAILEAYGNIFNESIKTITFDNGSEFYAHEDLKEAF